MLNLIKKDLIITRIYMILGIIIILLFSSTILLSINDLYLYVSFIFIHLMITIMTCNAEMTTEIMKKPDIIMTSLPLKRDNIVKSKYIIFGMYMLISSILLYLVVYSYDKYSFIGTISDKLGNLQNGISPELLFFSLAICIIYISISVPLHYLLGENSKIIGYILFVLLFIIPESLFRFSETNTGSSILDNILGIDTLVFSLLLLGLSLILYLASMKISIKLYNKKEF